VEQHRAKFTGMKVSLFTLLGVVVGLAMGQLAAGAIAGVAVGIAVELVMLFRRRSDDE
jgi:hypothetical protein